MNRAERRAIEFGRAFSPMRVLYNVPDLVGITLEQEQAWDEYCKLTHPSDHDFLWAGVGQVSLEFLED